MKPLLAPLLLLSISTCAPAKPAPPAPTIWLTPPPVASSSSAAPVASSAAPPLPVAAPVPEIAEPDCSDAAFAAAVNGLEAATARNDPDEIQMHIEKALAIHTRDVSLRERLARLHKDAGRLAEAAEQAEILVEIGDSGGAFAWTLLGLQAEATGASEKARAFYARSARLDPKGEGAIRLGARSRCTGALTRGNVGAMDMEIVEGWRGVFDVVDPKRMVRESDKPDPTTEAEARERVCIHGALNEITERGVCKGKGPWDVQTGHMHFHDHRMLIVPLPRGRFALWEYITGDGCRGGSQASAALTGDVIELRIQTNAVVNADVSLCDDGAHDAMTGPCFTGVSYDSLYYDARRGKLLAGIEEHASAEKHELKGWRLRRTEGADCNETVDLLPPLASK